MTGETIAALGNYYVKASDPFYAKYSGYSFLLIYQPPTPFCGPTQMRGFGPDQRELAITCMRAAAAAAVEDKRFARTKKRVESRIKVGEMPCPHDDHQLSMQLMKEGYRLVKSDRVYRWFARPIPPKKPQPTLFDGK